MRLLRPGGEAEYTCDGVVTRVATSTCAHCQHQTEIPSNKKMMEYVDVCRACMKLICLSCYGKPCTPKMREIERAEAAYYRKTQLAKMLGM